MILDLTFMILACFLSGNLAKAEPLKGDNLTIASEGKYPYVVSIANRKDDIYTEKLHRCTGVLITKEFVLTVAHCFTGKLLGEIRLLIGSVDLRKAKQYDPSMWITYHQWPESKNITKKYAVNDVAIIKLSDKVSSKIAKPARVSCKKTVDLHNEFVTLVAWGVTDENPRPSRYLLEAQVKILPNKICENFAYDLMKFKVAISEEYICTKGEPNAFVGHGDSGGPVMRKNSVVGISSGTFPKTGLCNLSEEIIKSRKFNIHCSIDFYRDFIIDVLKNY